MKIKHYWAKIERYCPETSEYIETLVVVKDTKSSKYAVCGEWEVPVSPKELEVIEEIAPPKGCEDMGLYYGYE